MTHSIDVTDKVTPPTDCTKGKHTFIPSAWRTSGDKQICINLICQYCLMTIDKLEQEVMACCHHDAIKTKKEKAKATDQLRGIKDAYFFCCINQGWS